MGVLEAEAHVNTIPVGRSLTPPSNCTADVGLICGNPATGYTCCAPGTQCDYGDFNQLCKPDQQTYPNGTAACAHSAGEVGCACYSMPSCCDPRKARGGFRKHVMSCDGVNCCHYS